MEIGFIMMLTQNKKLNIKRLMKSFHAGNLVNEDEGDMETPGLSE